MGVTFWVLYMGLAGVTGYAAAVINGRIKTLDLTERLGARLAKRPFKPSTRLRLLRPLYLFTQAVPILVAVAVAYRASLVPWIIEQANRSSVLGRGALTLGLMLFGGALYWLRLRRRRVYALTEIIVAGFSAHASLAADRDLALPASWLPIAGAVYLVVRGLDNLALGAKEAREAEAARAEASAPVVLPPLPARREPQRRGQA